jgi:hypothetical protein
MVAKDSKESEDRPSAITGMSRKEFLETVIKRATIAGAVIAAPKVVDKFLVPPAYAAVSLTTPIHSPHPHDPG